MDQPVRDLKAQLSQAVIGQEPLLTRMLIALLADGHLLVEGAPGLAKTRAVKALATLVEGDYRRVQFTPDLLPADLTGSDVYYPQEGAFRFHHGPLFHNLVLADEINRAPAKVQSALLEAMAERQITVGGRTYHLPELFMVMATQNPIEQEGTYPLPEAQLDRFLMHVQITYPGREDELRILRLARLEARNAARHVPVPPATPVSQARILESRSEVFALHMSEALEEYLVRVVSATRDPGPYQPDLDHWVEYGASPRATIALDRCARAHAWLAGREYVGPEDVRAVAPDVLRHRVLLSFEAEARGMTTDRFIANLLARIPVP